MSAEILRRAAAGLRDEWADSDGSPRPMGTAWHRERDFHLAVADWLDSPCPNDETAALAVARAYLGDDAT